MFRYQILIEYAGTNFRGWQVQKKGKTVQGLVQEKISQSVQTSTDPIKLMEGPHGSHLES